MSDLILSTGLTLQFDNSNSINACHQWRATFGSVRMYASEVRFSKRFYALELEWPSGFKLATGSDFAECEHRLFSKLIPYKVSVEIARACVQREWAA